MTILKGDFLYGKDLADRKPSDDGLGSFARYKALGDYVQRGVGKKLGGKTLSQISEMSKGLTPNEGSLCCPIDERNT